MLPALDKTKRTKSASGSIEGQKGCQRKDTKGLCDVVSESLRVVYYELTLVRRQGIEPRTLGLRDSWSEQFRSSPFDLFRLQLRFEVDFGKNKRVLLDFLNKHMSSEESDPIDFSNYVWIAYWHEAVRISPVNSKYCPISVSQFHRSW